MQTKQIWSLTGAVAIACFLISCAGKGNDKVTVDEVAQIDECFYPDTTNKKAPTWVCGAEVEGLTMHAVGVAETSNAGFSFMRQLATTDARTQIAQQMRVQVQNMVKSYVETTGQGDTETVDRVNSLVTKQITDETLEGTKVIRYLTSPNGTLYVLVGMDEESVRLSTANAVRSSINDDRAAWQQIRAEQAQDELATSIANQPFN